MHTVAIIIPTKNEARYLPRLLASLQSQTRHADDVVIADAGSTDETVAIAKTFGAKVVAGGSPAVGRNNGAAATRADIFVFLDADAILDRKDFLACVVDEFIARKLDVATVDVFVEHGAVSDRVSMTLYNTYVRLWGARHPHPIGTCMIARRDVHEKIHGFDSSVTFAEDHDYGLRVRDAGGVFGVLNSARVGFTTRRQEKIGRLRYLLVNVLAEPYIMLFGAIRSPRFGTEYDKPKSRQQL